MFKQSADDKAFFAWLGRKIRLERLSCDGCGRIAWQHRAHLDAKGNGGHDLNNIALLCPTNPFLLRKGCRQRQEKRTDAFMAELAAEGRPADLYAKARGHTAQWRKETGRG